MQWLMNRSGVLIQLQMTGALLGSRTVITATGANTYTTPVGCRVLIVEGIGGGGGGSSSVNSSAAQIALGCGGAGSVYMVTVPIATSSNVIFTATVGAGGVAGASGIATSFADANGFNYMTMNNAATGASLGTGTSEVFGLGGQGQSTNLGAADYFGSGNSSVVLHRVSGTVAINGRGGNGPFGGGPAGRTTQGTGAAGGKYGAGGSGGFSINAGGAGTGGAGGNGVIVVWEFY